MPISKDQLEQILRSSFPNAKIKLTDLVGDEDHYMLEISDQSLKGMPRFKQHMAVNKALKECLSKSLHAITIKVNE